MRSVLFSSFTNPILAAVGTVATYVVGHLSWSFDLLEKRIFGVVRRFAEDERAERTAVNAAHGFDERRGGTRLEIDQEASLAGRRLLRALLDRHAAGHVNGGGLGQVYVLAGGDGVGRLDWMEERRALNGDGVELLLQQAAIG